MNNFDDRIYLLLTLKKEELISVAIHSCAVPILLLAYNLFMYFIGRPPAIPYLVLAIALVIIVAFLYYIYSNRLDIDWELLDAPVTDFKPSYEKEQTVTAEGVNQEEAPISASTGTEKVPSTVCMEVTDEEAESHEFSFDDLIVDTFNKGTAKDVAQVAVNGVETKVRRAVYKE